MADAINGGGLHSTGRMLFAIAGSALASLIIGLAIFYIGYGQNVVMKSDLQNAIETYSPYARDRGAIQASLAKLEQDIRRVSDTQRDVLQHDAATSSRLDALQRDVDRLIGLHINR